MSDTWFSWCKIGVSVSVRGIPLFRLNSCIYSCSLHPKIQVGCIHQFKQLPSTSSFLFMHTTFIHLRVIDKSVAVWNVQQLLPNVHISFSLTSGLVCARLIYLCQSDKSSCSSQINTWVKSNTCISCCLLHQSIQVEWILQFKRIMNTSSFLFMHTTFILPNLIDKSVAVWWTQYLFLKAQIRL